MVRGLWSSLMQFNSYQHHQAELHNLCATSKIHFMRGAQIGIVFFLLFSLSSFQVFAQLKNNYEQQWKKIDSLITKKGLTQSALDEVDKIYASAKKEKNDAQVIKSLLYRMGLQGWDAKRAYSEALDIGMRPWYLGLKAQLYEFHPTDRAKLQPAIQGQ